MLQHGLVLNNKYQDIPDYFTIYPNDYFCPKSLKNGEIYLTDNSVTIHHFAGSWHTPYEKFKEHIAKMMGSKLRSLILSIKHRS